MFLHWLVGILCAFYFASFVLLLREVLRPGVLWFLRNLNDPDFNPVQEVYFQQFFFFFLLNKPLTNCDPLTDDSSSNCPSFETVCCFSSDIRHNRVFDALGSHTNFAEGHAKFLALLYCQFDVSSQKFQQKIQANVTNLFFK